MHVIATPAYRMAFIQYLRCGVPIDLSLKAEAITHPTSHYVWRTRGDAKVRPSHAANNGKIFAWNNPPPTGHPGEDYGCRCWAEPYDGFADDPPIEPVYPIETLIGLFSGSGLLRGLLSGMLRNVRDVDAKTLSAGQAESLRKFDRKLPRDAGEIKILRGKNGQRIFRADVPARNIPGSFARYEKVVDKAGNAISYMKTTYAPDGRIVHIKVK